MKIGIITSAGGHFFQLWQLRTAWANAETFWVTFPKEDVLSLLKSDKNYFAYYPESRNLINAIKNLLLAIKILHEEKPQILISAGAGIAPPFFLIARLMHIKTLYLEPIDFIRKPSLTGRILYHIADVFLVQDKRQRKWFPKAKYWGSSL